MGIFTGFHFTCHSMSLWCKCHSMLYILMRSLMFYLCTVLRNCITIYFSEKCFLSFAICFNHQVSIIYRYWLRTYKVSGTLLRNLEDTYLIPSLQLSLLQSRWPQPQPRMLPPQDFGFGSSLQFVCSSHRHLQS